MAERRMFAKTIIDSDAFLDMPISARLLYYDLGMRADDDGFVNSPKKIMRMVGASEDDMRILIGRKFIIPFDSGVVVIKHWRIHNYIQADRYKPTNYVAEKKQLEIKANKSYTLKADECIQDVSMLDTQVRLGKVSIDKNSIGEDGGYINNIQEPQSPPPSPPAPPVEPLNVCYQTDIDEIIATWNASAVTQKINKIPFGSRRYTNTVLCINNDLPDYLLTIKELSNMAWFSERKKRNDPIKYDWFCDPNNYLKVTEGNYKDLREEIRTETEQERKLRMIMEATEE